PETSRSRRAWRRRPGRGRGRRGGRGASLPERRDHFGGAGAQALRRAEIVREALIGRAGRGLVAFLQGGDGGELERRRVPRALGVGERQEALRGILRILVHHEARGEERREIAIGLLRRAVPRELVIDRERAVGIAALGPKRRL